MSKNLFWLFVMGMVFSLGVSSCAEDTKVENPYEDWRGCNELYLDSIVNVARKNLVTGDEKWNIFKNYQFEIGDQFVQFYEYDSVYVKYEIKHDEAYLKAHPEVCKPLYTDSVDVYYQGFLINGLRFDGNYTGKLNTNVHEPTRFVVSGLIPGMITALQELYEGEKVELYIPYQLAYGAMGSDPYIPGYSVLKFELCIDKVKHPVGPDDRSRAAKDIQQ